MVVLEMSARTRDKPGGGVTGCWGTFVGVDDADVDADVSSEMFST